MTDLRLSGVAQRSCAKTDHQRSIHPVYYCRFSNLRGLLVMKMDNNLEGFHLLPAFFTAYYLLLTVL